MHMQSVSIQVTSASFNALEPSVLKIGVTDITALLEPSTTSDAATTFAGIHVDAAPRASYVGFRYGWCL